MDLPFLIARVLHIGLGVFWAGTIFFNTAFLSPSMRDAGPEGASVGAGLMRRRFLDILPAAAILTILSGLYLYWRISAGFSAAWVHTTTGLTYAAGAIAALVALGLGLGILRPAMLQAAALSQSAAAAAPPEREKALLAAQALRVRAAATGQIIAWLLGATTIAMALARYL